MNSPTPFVTLNANGVRVEFGIPMCCHECANLDSGWSEWSQKTYYYCLKNVWFPTMKGTCKVQVPRYRAYRYFRDGVR